MTVDTRLAPIDTLHDTGVGGVTIVGRVYLGTCDTGAHARVGSGCNTRRIASPCNIRNRTSDLSNPLPPGRNYPYRASGLVLRPGAAMRVGPLYGAPGNYTK